MFDFDSYVFSLGNLDYKDLSKKKPLGTSCSPGLHEDIYIKCKRFTGKHEQMYVGRPPV